jgi:hypothetical protein
VQVQVSYAFKPAILPLDGSALTLTGTSDQLIVQ